jgi:hypothetical protein
MLRSLVSLAGLAESSGVLMHAIAQRGKLDHGNMQ